ncbi:MAG: toll/interleukin-1 receptor domain-containing protein [Chroococcidiopsidaceae cyanobacterium CP_BM_ER_R8_30]|nr:toll/interleukin-1 receptor domain-containing protein [Chroococcidiopsidaceae cyanobacterium CP_BM_ER_R8_30]
MVSESIEVFFSYSHKDEELRDKLEEHLASLKREGVIKSWYDRQIEAGAEWAKQIDSHLAISDIILLLISASFINSDYCWGIELEQSMKRHEAGEACVIPVILRPVSWKNAPFGKLQAFPKDAKPVETWNNPNEAFVSVTEGIRIAAENLLKQRQQKLRQQEILRTQYLKKVEEVLSHGRISLLGRDTLEEHRKELGLTPEEASVIENNAFEPYKRYEENLNKYKQSLLNVIQHEYPLSDETKNELKLRQRDLGLKSEDIDRIEQLIFSQAEVGLGLQEDKTIPHLLTLPKPETSDATIARLLAPPKPEIRNTIIAQISPDSTQGSGNSTIDQAPTPPEQEVPGATSPSLGPDSLLEQDVLLEILAEIIGPIAPALLQQASAQTSSTKELVEKLALYLSPKQQIELEKRIRALLKKSVYQSQTRVYNSPTLTNQVINASFLDQCEQYLSDVIGPIATLLIQDALKFHPQISPAKLVNVLAAKIPNPKKADEFSRHLLK